VPIDRISLCRQGTGDVWLVRFVGFGTGDSDGDIDARSGTLRTPRRRLRSRTSCRLWAFRGCGRR
jgi:hypothetical protein